MEVTGPIAGPRVGPRWAARVGRLGPGLIGVDIVEDAVPGLEGVPRVVPGRPPGARRDWSAPNLIAAWLQPARGPAAGSGHPTSFPAVVGVSSSSSQEALRARGGVPSLVVLVPLPRRAAGHWPLGPAGFGGAGAPRPGPVFSAWEAAHLQRLGGAGSPRRAAPGGAQQEALGAPRRAAPRRLELRGAVEEAVEAPVALPADALPPRR